MEEFNEKRYYFFRIHQLKDKGVKFSKHFTINDSLEEIKSEYFKGLEVYKNNMNR